MKPRFVGVTGLPRAGSTLMCQLLAQHPEIHSDGHSSPLCNTLLGIRRMVSDDSFFLAQLDGSFERSYGHLQAAMTAFLQHWHHDCTKPVLVDKNRAWLHAVELLLTLDPDARLVVCIRELGQIYGSIEAQHQRTILLDFIDHLADHDRFGRADMLFAKDKAIGAPLMSLQAMVDLPRAVRERLYFVRFEDLVDNPAACLAHLHAWLGVTPHAVDTEHMTVGPHESDSHYRMKYLHGRSARLVKPPRHEIPQRIQSLIDSSCAWYRELYYADRS